MSSLKWSHSKEEVFRYKITHFVLENFLYKLSNEGKKNLEKGIKLTDFFNGFIAQLINRTFPMRNFVGKDLLFWLRLISNQQRQFSLRKKSLHTLESQKVLDKDSSKTQLCSLVRYKVYLDII